VNPVTCSLLWNRCLFDRFSISDFGVKWPLKWKFSKVSFRIPRRDTERRFTTKFGGNRPLRSCRKVVWFTTQKKLGLRGTRLSPHFAHNGPIAPRITWTLSPFDISTYTEFGPDRLRFAGLILERLIFRPKKSIQYRLSAYKDSAVANRSCSASFTSDNGGSKCDCRRLSICLLARLVKNAWMDLDEMLRVDRSRDMAELINFWARSGS